MFTIRFKTVQYRPDLQITLRSSGQDFGKDLPGIYEDDEWRFTLDEDDYPNGIEFKFVLERTYWMLGANLPCPRSSRVQIIRSPSTRSPLRR